MCYISQFKQQTNIRLLYFKLCIILIQYTIYSPIFLSLLIVILSDIVSVELSIRIKNGFGNPFILFFEFAN